MSQPKESGASTWIVTLLLVGLMILGAVLLKRAEIEVRVWMFVAFWLVVIAAVVLWDLSWSLAVPWLKLLWWMLRIGRTGGPKPRWVKPDASGRWRQKCTKCGEEVVVTKGEPGEVAFQCANCGEISRWLDPSEASQRIKAFKAQKTSRGK